MLNGDEELARRQMRVGGHLIDPAHRRKGHALFQAETENLIPGVPHQPGK
jgi:hypothetical protein